MRRAYTQTEKQVIIDRYMTNREPAAIIIADTGIPKSTFYSWIRAYQDAQCAGKRKGVNIHKSKADTNRYHMLSMCLLHVLFVAETEENHTQV